MSNIYDSTLPHDSDAYTIGLIDHLDPTHSELSHADTLDTAASHVLTMLNWYQADQIVVLDNTGKRLRVCPLATIEEWANGIAEGGYPSDFVSFR